MDLLHSLAFSPSFAPFSPSLSSTVTHMCPFPFSLLLFYLFLLSLIFSLFPCIWNSIFWKWKTQLACKISSSHSINLNLNFHIHRISCSACRKAKRRMKPFYLFFTFRILLYVLLVQRSGSIFDKLLLTFRLKSPIVCKSWCRVEYFTVYSFDAVKNLCYCLEWWKKNKNNYSW